VQDKLSVAERTILQQIAQRERAVYVRRARLLLLWDEGRPTTEIAELVGLSYRRVRFWLNAFAKKRMDVFPSDLAAVTELPAGEEQVSKSDGEPFEEARVQQVPIQPTKSVIEKPPKYPGLEPDDSMAEAARKTFYLHFQRMLYHEPGTRLGEDIEELHDMRVATRRMRAAFRVFHDYLGMDEWRPFLRGLRKTGRVLGRVRDLDVFWEKTQRYLDQLHEQQEGGLDSLRATWMIEREQAREKMLAFLDSKRYARFVEKFGEFLQRPDVGARPLWHKNGEPRPHRLRHVVSVVLYERLASVLAYDEWVTAADVPTGRLHRLRIAAKRLRYALEFFYEILGPETPGLIADMKRLQDHLGDLQDAVVASQLLRDFLTWGTWGPTQVKGAAPPTEPVIAPGVAAYLAYRQAELIHLLVSFPLVWEYFRNPDFRQSVGLVLAPL
jgi:CHAD domain-containing protein